MSLSPLLLLLLLVCSSHASHFYGTVMTFFPKNNSADGSVQVVLRYKLSFNLCTHSDTWDCISGDCGNSPTVLLNLVDQESSGEWCQREGVMSRQISTNAPFQLRLDGGNWINNENRISDWRALTVVDLRNRSDTGQANRSPQTTVLPALRVPSNCQREFNLLAFDPDGDRVECRYGNTLSECNPCTPPSVLSLSTSCALSFSTTSSNNEVSYVVQLVMEDFPNQNIVLTQTDGSNTGRSTNDALSSLPVQFAVKVDAAVQSCTEGHYLPRFLPPTPANRAQLYTPVHQNLSITIKAEANNSIVSELLFSGPHNIENRTGSAGQFILTWTPSEQEDGESHPICFVVQAVNNLQSNPIKYHSALRCVIVSVGNEPSAVPPTTTTLLITTTTNTPATVTTTQSTTTIPSTITQVTTTFPTTTPLTTTTTTPTAATTVQDSTSTLPTTTPLTTTMTTPTAANTPTTVTTTHSTTTITPSATTPPAATTSPTTASTPPVTEILNTTSTESPGPRYVVGLKMKLSSETPLSEDNRNAVLQQLKDELVRRGLPADITLRFK